MQLATFYDHVKDIAHQEKISLTEAHQRVRSLGVTHLEVSQNNILGREDEVGHELAYADLGISTIPAYFDFGRDPRIDAQSEPTLEAARYLGAKKLLVIPGFFREDDPPEERQRQRENIAAALPRLAEKAAGYGVSLVMEEYDHPLSPFSTLSGLRYFLDRCPAVGCCLDTGNFRFMAEDELTAYAQLKGKVAHVHLKDRACTPDWGAHAVTAADGQLLYPAPVGKGIIQIKPLLTQLTQDGYTGLCTIEHYGAANMWAALQESVQWLLENFPFETKIGAEGDEMNG